jgi:hypothetical protein
MLYSSYIHKTEVRTWCCLFQLLFATYITLHFTLRSRLIPVKLEHEIVKE